MDEDGIDDVLVQEFAQDTAGCSRALVQIFRLSEIRRSGDSTWPGSCGGSR